MLGMSTFPIYPAAASRPDGTTPIGKNSSACKTQLDAIALGGNGAEYIESQSVENRSGPFLILITRKKF